MALNRNEDAARLRSVVAASCARVGSFAQRLIGLHMLLLIVICAHLTVLDTKILSDALSAGTRC